jgi:hypothetical protein
MRTKFTALPQLVLEYAPYIFRRTVTLKNVNLDEKIKKAKAKTTGKEGGALRDAKKAVKRLQRAKRKLAVAAKRQLGKKGAAEAEAAKTAPKPAAQ